MAAGDPLLNSKSGSYLLLGTDPTTDYFGSMSSTAALIAGVGVASTTSVAPAIMVKKTVNSTTGTWDCGTAFFELDVLATSATYGAAITGSVIQRQTSPGLGDGGDVMGVHARARYEASGGSAFGLWCVCDSSGFLPHFAHGIEIDMFNGVNNTKSPNISSVPLYIGLTIGTGEQGGGATDWGIWFTSTAGVNTDGFYTGINFEINSIVGGVGNEAIRLQGGNAPSYGAIGLKFEGYHNTAVNTTLATFADNLAITLKAGQIIMWWGTGAQTGSWCGIKADNGTIQTTINSGGTWAQLS